LLLLIVIIEKRWKKEENESDDKLKACYENINVQFASTDQIMNESKVQKTRKSAIHILRRVTTLKRECRGTRDDIYGILALRE